MTKNRIISFWLIAGLIVALEAGAAPVGMPVANKRLGPTMKMILEETYYGYETPAGIMVSVSGDYDRVYERELDVNGTEAEFEAGYGTLMFTLGNVLDVYGLLGGVTDGGIDGIGTGMNADVTFSGGDLLYGGGVNAVLLRSVNGKFTIFAGGIYRTTSGMEYDSATINGVRYMPDQFASYDDAKWKEWQGALGMSVELAGYYEPGGYTIYFVPYIGAKYSDTEISSSVTVDSTRYLIEDAGSGENVGMFVGVLLNLAPSCRWKQRDAS